MSYHEVRYAPGIAEANEPLAQVIVYVDDEGVTYYPSDPDYVEPEPGAFDFLSDFGQQLSQDKERIDGNAIRDKQQIEATEQAVAQRLDDSPQAHAVREGPMPAPVTEGVEDPGPAPTRVPPPPGSGPSGASGADNQPMPQPQPSEAQAHGELSAEVASPDPQVQEAPDPNKPQ